MPLPYIPLLNCKCNVIDTIFSSKAVLAPMFTVEVYTSFGNIYYVADYELPS